MGRAVVQEIEEFGNFEEPVAASSGPCQGDADVGDDGLGSLDAAMSRSPPAQRRFLLWRTPTIWDRTRLASGSQGTCLRGEVTAELGSFGLTQASESASLSAAAESGGDPAGDSPDSPAPFLRASSAASSTGGFTRAASASSAAGGFARAASASSAAAGGFTRAASAASSAAGSALGRTASGALRRISSGVVGGLKRLRNMGFGRQSLTGSLRARGGDGGASVATPSRWLKSAVAAECAFAGLGRSRVEVYPAPVKTPHRMREKVREYAGEAAAAAGEGRGWPLCANILDPVRASVVCSGPAEILRVLGWFTGWSDAAGGDAADGGGTQTAAPDPCELGSPGSSSSPAALGAQGLSCRARRGAGTALMPVCRIKNKFAFPKEELVGGCIPPPHFGRSAPSESFVRRGRTSRCPCVYKMILCSLARFDRRF